MRILHVHKYFHDRDGAGRYLFDVMTETEKRGHTTAILAMHDSRNQASVWSEYFVSNLDTSEVGKGRQLLRQIGRAWYSREAAQKTEAIIDAFRPDVMHVHNLYTHLSPSVLSVAKRRNIPVIFTVHDYALVSANYILFDGASPLSPHTSFFTIARTRFIKGSWLATAISEILLRLQRFFGMWQRGISTYICASHAVAETLRAVGFSGQHIEVLPYPVGPFIAHRSCPYIEGNRPRQVLFASRFETYKGVDLALSLAEQLPDVSFLFVGHGSQEGVLRQKAQTLPNVKLIRSLASTDLWDLMQEVAAIVVPSRWPEPYGLIALEALACGTPALVSNRGGLPEIVEDGVSGFVCDPDNFDQWKHRLTSFLDDHDFQRRMRHEAYERACRIGNPATHMDVLLELYRHAGEGE